MWLHFAFGDVCLCACAEGQEDISRLAHAEVRLHWLSFWLQGLGNSMISLRGVLLSLREPISTRDTSRLARIPLPSLSLHFVDSRFAFGACAKLKGGGCLMLSLTQLQLLLLQLLLLRLKLLSLPLHFPAPEIAPDPSPSAVELAFTSI